LKTGSKLLVFAGIAAGITALVGISLPPRVEEVRVLDDLARPGEPISLAAKVVGGRLRGMFGGIEGAVVSFEIDGGHAGASRTDGAGRAAVRYNIPFPGDYQVTARAKLASGEELPLAIGLLRVIDAGQSIVVTDIDGTIADVTELGFVFRGAEPVRPIPGAVEAMQALAREFAVVYLSRRDEDLGPRTKEWLAANAFPAGPVLLSRSLHDPFDASTFKRETLRMLKRRFPNIVAGIGNSASDAEAYASNSIPPFLVGRVEGSPSGARTCANWNEAVAAIEQSVGGR
jgi:hypothetical protein